MRTADPWYGAARPKSTDIQARPPSISGSIGGDCRLPAGAGGCMNQQHDLVMPVTAIDHTLGPSHAPVTIVEYGDFECPTCKQAAPSLKLLLSRFPEQVRLAFRHFPLEEVHPHALCAAEASEVAAQ